MANEFKIKHGFISTGDGSITGGLTVTGAAYADNNSRVATRPWVTQFLSDNSYSTATDISTAISNLVDSAPGTLDTLNELAAALGDDPNFATTVTDSIATKLPLAGGTLTGQVIFPSAATTKPVLSNGFISRNDNDDTSGRHDIWGISERYYPSNSTAGDAWGIQWSGTPNDIVFVGGGQDKFTISLDEGNIVTLGAVTASGGNSSQWNTAYGWGNHAGLYDSAGSAAAVEEALNTRIEEEVLPSIPTNNNQLTNGAGYITGYTETDTLASVTGRGATTNIAVNFGANGGAVNLTGLGSHMSFKDQDNVWNGYVGFDGNTGRLDFPGRNIRITSGYNGTIELNTGVSGYNSGRIHIPQGYLSVDNNYVAATAFHGESIKVGTAGSTPTVNYGIFHHSGIGLGIASGAGGSNQGISFWSHNGSSFFESVKIAGSTGNMGIGTTNPADKLHVSGGNIRLDNGAGDGFIKDSAGNDRFYFGTGTYVNSNTGGPVAFQVAGSEKMRVNYNGNVGIGTADPRTLLHIGSGEVPDPILDGVILTLAGDGQYYQAVQDDKHIFIGVDASSYGIVGMLSDHALGFRTGNTERMRILTNGNVGIGVTNPARKLQVDSAAGYPLSLNSTQQYLMEFARNGVSEWWFAVNNGDFKFHENGVGDQVIIKAGGNVGIGTTSPTSKLQVSGNIDATGVISQTFWTNDSIRKLAANASLNFRTAAGPIEMILDGSGNLGIGTTSPIDKLQVDGSLFVTGKIYNGSTNDSAGITFPGTTTRIDGFNGITFHASSTNVGSQSERMRITSSGNIGIGTTTPNAKLHIQDSVAGSEVFAVDGTNGRLFTVTDSLDDSLFSVNTIAGLPVIEAFGDNTVKLGPFTNPVIIDSSGSLSIGGATAATQSYVDTSISNLIGGAPGALNTLNELAAALGDDSSFATTITNSLSTKLTIGQLVPSQSVWSNATRFTSEGDIGFSGAGNHSLQVFSEQGNDAFMAFHISSDHAVYFGLENGTNRLYTGGWSLGSAKHQIWDTRDFTSTNVSNWNTAYGWGNHAGLYASISHTHIITAINETEVPPAGVSIQSGPGSGNAQDWAYPYGTRLSAITSPGRSFEIMSTTYPNGELAMRTLDGSNIWDEWKIMLDANNYSSYAATRTGGNTSGTWPISITGSAASATTSTSLSGLGSIQSTSTGTSYTANYQVRENAGGGSNTNEVYAPQLAFHWSGVVASSIMMESSGRIAIRNNPGGSYENFAAAVITATGGNSTQWNTAYSWGNHAGLYLGATAKAADSELLDGLDSSVFMRKSANSILDMNNYNIQEVNHITMNDPGYGEGVQWANFMIYECPDDLSNQAGNFHVASTGDSSIRVTVDTNGNLYPSRDRQHTLGLDSNRWQIVFCEILDSAGQHEKNLQNPEGEKSVGDYATGTVLVWKGGKNIPCTEYADHMRMGIAVKDVASPLIQGAEPVLVTGSVNEGDYLITSRKEGHAEAISPELMRQQGLYDCVLGKALENGQGESHLVKTWINI